MAVIIDGSAGITTPGETNTGNLSVAGSTTLTTPLPVASGGTGATSLSGITTGTSTNIAGGSNGTIPYQSASGTTQMLAVGSAGQLLQTNGAGAPTWVTASGSGLVCIAVASASSVSSVDFTTGIDSTYDEYEFHFQNVIPSSGGGPNFLLRTSANSGSSYAATSGDYSWSSMYNYSNGPSPIQSDGNATSTGLLIDSSLGVTGNTAAGGISGVVRLINPAGTASVKHFIWDANNQNSSTVSLQIRATGSRNSTAVVNAVRFIFSSGNIASGLFKLYGLRKSV